MVALGCANAPNGAPGKGYAGLTSYQAATAASGALKQERGQPDSPVFHKLLLVKDVAHGRLPDVGRAAWKARLETLEHAVSPYCLWIWSGGTGPFEENYVYALDKCPAGTVG